MPHTEVLGGHLPVGPRVNWPARSRHPLTRREATAAARHWIEARRTKLRVEDDNVRKCIAYARRELSL
jgi:hypothetical protein